MTDYHLIQKIYQVLFYWKLTLKHKPSVMANLIVRSCPDHTRENK